MSSFTVLFDSYKNLLSKKEFEDKGNPLLDNTSTITSSDIQSATKKIFTIAVNQNIATLNQLEFYEILSPYFINKQEEEDEKEKDELIISCSPLLREIGWDLLTELFLLYNRDNRFDTFVFGICNDISARELSIMFSEVFTHPMFSINATHQHYQLHTIQNHYILNDEDSEQQKQMMLNLNITNQQINMDASDDILSFHKNINYIKTQTLFIKCIIILFNKIVSTKNTNDKTNINHFYQSLIPTAILHFQTLSKELSYQFYLHNTTQYHHTHHHTHDNKPKQRQRSMSTDSIKAIDATKKERQLWLSNSKKEYEIYLNTIYKLFSLMVANHCNLRISNHEIKDEIVNINDLIKCFESNDSNSLNTLWLARYGFGVLSGIYWWYNVFYSEDMDDGDVNNDSIQILQNMKKPGYNIFVNDHIDALKREILVKLCHNVGMNGNILFGIRDYLTQLELKLESEKRWNLNTEQIVVASGSKSNPSTPTPQLQPMSSIGHPDLNTIVEENNSANNCLLDEEDKLVLINGTHDDDDNNNNNDGWSDEDDNNNDYPDIDEANLKKVEETQQLVDELKGWNEFIDLFGVSCYYHSLWVLLQSDDCIENNGLKFKKHSKHIWKCITLLFEQLTTLPAGIEFGEFIINTIYPTSIRNVNNNNKQLDLSLLLSANEFHSQGLWQSIQHLTQQLKSISDRALHQKLWQFIVHLINCADLKTRFQCIVSTALQCPIPIVQSLMFTELKNQIFNNWNIDIIQSEKGKDKDKEEEQQVEEKEEEKEELNPFCSRQVVMVLVQRLSKELQNMSLQTINSELDSLNACLNLCRFILTKDKETNYTQIYDEDCPLKDVIKSLYDQMNNIANKHEENNKNNENNKQQNKLNELEDFQKQMMINQFLVSLDLVKRIQEMYHK